jgi:hypothetical protein
LSNIKIYQISLSVIVAMNIPLIYLVLKYNLPPYWVFGVRTLLNFVAYIFRIFYLRKHMKLSISNYFREVGVSVIAITTIALIVTYVLTLIMNLNVWSGVIPFISISIFVTILTAFFIGFKETERKAVLMLIKSKFYRN